MLKTLVRSHSSPPDTIYQADSDFRIVGDDTPIFLENWCPTQDFPLDGHWNIPGSIFLADLSLPNMHRIAQDQAT